jgi:hypothetical protein
MRPEWADLRFDDMGPISICGAVAGPVERVADAEDVVVVGPPRMGHLLSMVIGESVANGSMRARGNE